MIFSVTFGNEKYTIQANNLEKVTDGVLIQGSQPTIVMPTRPQSFYKHGWQSWSLATWLPADFHLPVQKPSILHPLQVDPLYARHPAPNGSGVGAVRFEDGNVLLLGALDLNAHVALHKNELHGWYEGREGDWLVAYGQEIGVFKQYAGFLGERLGTAKGKSSPRVWCSWYSLYTAVDQVRLIKIIDHLGDLPFDVIQVDDGWQMSIGDWEPNNKFPDGINAIADKIRSTGRQAGLWLAPLIAVKSSRLFRERPDWFLKDMEGRFVTAGFNWEEQLYSLDTTQPDVLDWLAALMRKIRGWGFDYLKLDFLYAGALPGVHYKDMPRESAYRQGLKVLRNAMGDDAFFLACGAPIIPSIGLCDAIRVGPDVAEIWERHRDAVLLYNPTTPGTKNAIRTSVNRLWLNSLVATDPDVAYFRSQHNWLNSEQKRMLQDLALVCNVKASSDLPAWLNSDERKNLRLFLEKTPIVKQINRYSYLLNDRLVDFSPALPLPKPPQGIEAIVSTITGWAGSRACIIRKLDKQGKQALEARLKDL